MPTSTITATTISRYVRLERCERYLRWSIQRDEPAALVERYRALAITLQPLTPLLSAAGAEFEQAVVDALPGLPRDLQDSNPSATADAIMRLVPGERCVLVQAEVAGQIGCWPCHGRADVIQAVRRQDGALDLLVADIKASARERVEYRLQVAFYLRLLTGMLHDRGAVVGEHAGAILRPHEDGTLPTVDDPDARFDVAAYEDAIHELMEGPESDLERIMAGDLADAAYRLDFKCDSCMFNQLCMVESADRQDITMIHHLQAAEARALRGVGIHTLRDLALLKRLPPGNAFGVAFTPEAGKERLVEELSVVPTLGPRLDRLVQRARIMLRRYDSTVAAHTHLLDGAFSQLPADDANPDLVKVFLDAQHDYIQDRMYMVGALVRGPRGAIPVSHLTEGPPSIQNEAAILTALVEDVLAAARQVATDPESAPLHLYLFDAHDQQVWLDALQRNLAALCSIPTMFDLLTSSPALEQGMFSLVAAELRDRRNLDLTCQNLHSVASRWGFSWKDGTDDFRSIFRLRLFDHQVRRDDGVWVERSSRFNSTIPLEYAYGAWGKLPDDPHSRGQYDRYRAVTPDLLVRFQVQDRKSVV